MLVGQRTTWWNGAMNGPEPSPHLATDTAQPATGSDGARWISAPFHDLPAPLLRRAIPVDAVLSDDDAPAAGAQAAFQRPHQRDSARRGAHRLGDRIARSTVTWSVLGTADLRLNGHRLGDARLAPGQSDFSTIARCRTVDLTALVRALLDGRAPASDTTAVRGADPNAESAAPELVLSAELGRGFYDMHTLGAWQWESAPWRGRPALWLRWDIELHDGARIRICTDQQWRCATGARRFDSLYEGETWEEPREPAGWREPGFDDSPWAAATPHPHAPQLREAITPPIRVIEQPTVSWTQVAPSHWVGDLGRVIAGWVRVEPQRPGPHRLEVMHGESLGPDGRIDTRSVHIPTGRFQRDIVTVDQKPYEAEHSWKGFRYLEVTGAEVGADVQVIPCEARADVPVTGTFACSDPTLTWLHEAFVATAAMNLFWVPTDTPTYEKNGWTGDALTSLPALLASFDLRTMMLSWLQDMRDAQRDDGALPVIVPSAGWGFAPGPCAPAPEWTTLYPILVEAVAQEYGEEVWPEHRESVLRYLRHELSVLDADGLAVGILGDYLSPGTWGAPPEDTRFYATSALIRALRTVHDSPGADASGCGFGQAADALTAALHRVFFDETSGCFRTGVPGAGDWPQGTPSGTDDSPQSAAPGTDTREPAPQPWETAPGAPSGTDTREPDPQPWETAPSGPSGTETRGPAPDPAGERPYRQAPNALALAHGLCPPGTEQTVLDSLLADLAARDGHHHVGCLGIAVLPGVLTRAGHGAEAMRMATHPQAPSWEAWRRAGHSTLLEMWVDPVRSRAHYFHGSGAIWLHEDVLGLRRTGPAWSSFTVAPTVLPGLTWARGRRGKISVDWAVRDRHFHLTVAVPADAQARVELPDGTVHEAGPGEHRFTCPAA